MDERPGAYPAAYGPTTLASPIAGSKDCLRAEELRDQCIVQIELIEPGGIDQHRAALGVAADVVIGARTRVVHRR